MPKPISLSALELLNPSEHDWALQMLLFIFLPTISLLQMYVTWENDTNWGCHNPFRFLKGLSVVHPTSLYSIYPMYKQRPLDVWLNGFWFFLGRSGMELSFLLPLYACVVVFVFLLLLCLCLLSSCAGLMISFILPKKKKKKDHWPNSDLY